MDKTLKEKLDIPEKIPSFVSLIEKSITDHWDLNALTDYKGATLQYKDVARKIEKVHILFEQSGVMPGDKVALCGRNMSHWAVAFLASVTYGAIVVPILHEFTPEQAHNIVNHSDAKLLFVGDVVAKQINPDEMPDLLGIVNLIDFSLLISRSEKLTYAREHLNELFGKKYPKYFRKEHVQYFREADSEDLAMINYTSGTTGFSKGVMLPYRALWGNADFADKVLGPHIKAGDKTISILPMAHMYGNAFEFVYEFISGCHIHYLTKVPSPAVVAQAFADVKPVVIIAVPLIIEKIIKKKVLPKVSAPHVKALLKTPVVGSKLKAKICQQVYEAFGGHLYEIIIGGAALNQEVEQFLTDIGFPVTVGYGATECAPIISYDDCHDRAVGSCGRAAYHMEVMIDSPDPQNIPGEILTRGCNTMLGYYKNEEATKETLIDGWYHTGDLGIMDAEGHIFIKGRSKNMLLGASGQNIYPEEIEDHLSSLPYVLECLVVQRGDKLYGLVYPDYDDAKKNNVSNEDLIKIMEQNRIDLNAGQPAYQKLTAIELMETEFAKTPKKSIKRFLYN